MILTDNWEEECCQSDEGALGGGVRYLREIRYPIVSIRYREITATQQCAMRIPHQRSVRMTPHIVILCYIFGNHMMKI